MVPRACRGAFSLRPEKNACAGQAAIRGLRQIQGIESKGARRLPRGCQSSTRKNRSLMAGHDKEIRIKQANRVEWCPELAEGLSVFDSQKTLAHGRPR